MAPLPKFYYNQLMQKQHSLPSPVKALALDLDGTALGPGAVMSSRTARALRACIDRGIRVIICTGRPAASADIYRQIIGAEGPMVCCNGAAVVDMPGGATIGLSLLDPEAAAYCVDLSRSMGVYFQVYFPPKPGGSGGPWETLMAEQDGPEAAMYRNHTGMKIRIGDLKAALAAPDCTGCIKAMFIAEPAVQERIRPRLEERFGGRVYIARTYSTFLELMAPGASKGAGLKTALARLGLEPAGVIALGDEENDLPLFDAAGFRAAPANAKEAVRAAADLVIASNEEDGVAQFLEERLLAGFARGPGRVVPAAKEHQGEEGDKVGQRVK